MRILQKTLVAAALAGSGLWAVAAQAASFSGISADITDFANGSEVSLIGKYVSGVNLLNDNVGGVGVSTTINGVLFKGTQPGQFFEDAGSFANSSFVYHGGNAASGLWSSGGAYGTLAGSQIYNVDNPNSNSGDGFGVINLTPGQHYQLQVFMLEDRVGISKTFPLQFQQVAWTGFFDQIDNTNPPTEIGFMSGITIGGNGQANGEIATINFTVDAGYNGLLVNTWDNGAFNGMQLRTISTGMGDFNNDGVVNNDDIPAMLQALVDLNKYKSDRGLTDIDLTAIGDLNGDGVLNNLDIQSLLNMLGAGTGAGSITTVPEPSAWALASLGAVALMTIIFRRSRRI